MLSGKVFVIFGWRLKKKKFRWSGKWFEMQRNIFPRQTNYLWHNLCFKISLIITNKNNTSKTTQVYNVMSSAFHTCFSFILKSTFVQWVSISPHFENKLLIKSSFLIWITFALTCNSVLLLIWFTFIDIYFSVCVYQWNIHTKICSLLISTVFITIHLFRWHFYPKRLTVSAWTMWMLPKSCKNQYINFITCAKYAFIFSMKYMWISQQFVFWSSDRSFLCPGLSV